VTPAEIESFATERDALVARVRDRREIETEAAEVSVDFADPDRAVRERLSEVELSGAASEIDDLVRDDAVVDSNLRDRVTERVRERLDDGTLGENSVDGDTSPDHSTDESSGADDTDDADNTGHQSSGADDTDDTDDTDNTGDQPSDTSGTDGEPTETDSADDTTQLTMEDMT
jgi:hypothetical protein